MIYYIPFRFTELMIRMASNSDMDAQIHCCLKQCQITNGYISDEQDRAEVKTFVPSETASAGVKFNVTWGKSGDAIFHKGDYYIIFYLSLHYI